MKLSLLLLKKGGVNIRSLWLLQSQLSCFSTTDSGAVRGEGKVYRPKYHTKQSVEREMTSLKSGGGGMSFQGVRDGNRDYVENDLVKTQVLKNIERLQNLYEQFNPDATDKSI